MRGLARALSALLTLLTLVTTTSCLPIDLPSPEGAGASTPSPDSATGPELIFSDDFDRTELGDDWGTYSGKPGGDDHSWWDARHVELRDGRLVLAGYQRDGRWTTGGVSNWPVTQTYGRWEIRFRADSSDEITYHFLLWPQRDAWPPEIDFMENFGGTRQSGSAFVHYLDDGQGAAKTERTLDGVDFTQWHTVGVDWTQGRIDFLLDGEVWDSVHGDVVPDEPMWLGLQAQSGGCERSAAYGWPRCPDAGVPDRADVEIDWVKVWSATS